MLHKIPCSFTILLIHICCITEHYAQVLDLHPSIVDFDIPEIAMLSVVPHNQTVQLRIDRSTNAGKGYATSYTNNDKWINFSSTLTEGGSLRSIFVQIIQGAPPSGTSVQLNVSEYQGIGDGILGNSLPPIILSKIPQPIINNIGGGYTGTDISNGFQLHYELLIDNYDLLNYEDSTSLNITYTLVDQ